MPYKDRQRRLEYDRAYAKSPAGQNSRRKSMYGITLDAFNEMLRDQGFKCAICPANEPGGKGSFYLDHDHKTGEVRGLLCHHCNSMLGMARDNPDTLRAGAEYLNGQRCRTTTDRSRSLQT